MRAPAARQGRGRAADRARRHRRRLAGRAGDRTRSPTSPTRRVGAAVRYLLRGAAAQGKLQPRDPARPEEGSRLRRARDGQDGRARAQLFERYRPHRALRRRRAARSRRTSSRRRSSCASRAAWCKLLQERTADGYVFRTDLRLRPDPASTQIAISLPSALDYYESIGQNWERAAMIKARPCAGDIAAGEAFLRELAPFIWRKYLDYAAVADIHAMKRQMHAYRGHDEIAVEGHNIKLGRGGIREIEFFVQTQQLIAGGRHPELRGRETLATLTTSPTAAGSAATPRATSPRPIVSCARSSIGCRWSPTSRPTRCRPSATALERFARFLGFAGPRRVRGGAARAPAQGAAPLCAAVRGCARRPRPRAARSPFRPTATTARRSTSSPRMGFRRPVEVSQAVRRWLAGEYRSLKGEFARAHLAELVPVLIDHLARAENPDAALVALDRFLAGLHGGARLLVAAASQSRSRRAARAHARHRAAARRHSGASTRR